jgi:hypothetical protein
MIQLADAAAITTCNPPPKEWRRSRRFATAFKEWNATFGACIS